MLTKYVIFPNASRITINKEISEMAIICSEIALVLVNSKYFILFQEINNNLHMSLHSYCYKLYFQISLKQSPSKKHILHLVTY